MLLAEAVVYLLMSLLLQATVTACLIAFVAVSMNLGCCDLHHTVDTAGGILPACFVISLYTRLTIDKCKLMPSKAMSCEPPRLAFCCRLWYLSIDYQRSCVLMMTDDVCVSLSLVRPPDIVVGGLRFYHNSVFFFFYYCLPFLSATLWAPWTELNRNQPHAWKWVLFENVSEIWGYPPLQIGTPKLPFLITSQVNSNFNGLYLPDKTWHS